MLPQEIENIIKKGEGQTVDFKTIAILSDSFKLAKLMVAFANNLHVSKKYGGLILIGVKNDGNPEGMSAKQGHEEHVMNIARDKCTPALIPQFEVCNLRGNTVYVLTIPKMTKYPHAVKLPDCNAYYIRVGTTTRVATPEELQELFVGTGRPTINQVIQRIRESVPSISKAYRSILIAPSFVVKSMIEFDPETEHWLRNTFGPSELVVGNSYASQDGVIFRFDKQTVPEYFAKVTKEGVIYYREPIEHELGGVHIELTTRVVGEMLKYAQKVYERFKYASSCVVKLEFGNIKGMHLTRDSPLPFHRRLTDCTFDEDRVLMIEREPAWIDITQNRVPIVVSIITEFCRSFHFSITEKYAKSLVEKNM